MLIGLTLRNFKCFESAEIPLGRITVLIGPNGSGKSSVLHALALLRQSRGQGQLRYAGPYVDLSGYDDVICQKDSTRTLEVSYSAAKTLEHTSFSYQYQLLSKQSLALLKYGWEYGGWPEQVS